MSKGDPSRNPEMQASHEEESVPGPRCTCGGESMAVESLPRFDRRIGFAFLILGFLVLLFISLLLGLIMVLTGAYLSLAQRPVWWCPACGTVVERKS